MEVRHDGAADRLRPRLDRRQDLTAQRHGLLALGVDPGRIYVDHGLTGTNRERPGLREALAACREGDTLVVTKLDRLARSLPDARAIVEELTLRQVRLSSRRATTSVSPRARPWGLDAVRPQVIEPPVGGRRPRQSRPGPPPVTELSSHVYGPSVRW
ncbi:recombinase family protein [Geodermatophilus chilensis]|uniref:recombinase family protein n=1 Tax=Geodermatophilus chilensis TaxID=2035835 RepID=UPI001E2AF8C9|nr:recombinase family protein [Geodermatophilus chilensis]